MTFVNVMRIHKCFAQRRLRTKYWKFWLLGALLLCGIAVRLTYKKNTQNDSSWNTTFSDEYYLYHLREFINRQKGSGCEMPALDPFDKTILTHYHEVPDHVECPGIDWVECNISKCFVSHTIIARMREVVCIFKDIIYVNDDNYHLGDAITVQAGGVYVLNKSDHVKVSCTGYSRNGLRMFLKRWQGHKAGFRPVEHQVKPSAHSINILMVLFDSMSRNAFIRRMPKSYQFLTEELNAVFLKSYNILGDGTARALFPILTGYSELYPNMKTDKKLLELSFTIFSVLKKMGYRTGFFEDIMIYYRATFSYVGFEGFSGAPSDHYLQPFFMDAKKMATPRAIASGCLGSVPTHSFLLNYTTQMFKLDGKKFCVTFSSGLSHDYLSEISMADGDLVHFLKNFRDDGRLEDTALFVMADHGSRFSTIRRTYQGRLEERLPAVSLVLPERLKRERPHAQSNLEANSQVLTTPFDMHTTLLDILGQKSLRNKFVVPGADMERGLSFLDKIPSSRSCPEAGILPHWCACAAWVKLPHKDTLYVQIAQALAKRINALTDDVRTLCARRKLSSIEWVMRHSPNEGMFVDKEAKSRVRAPREYYQTQIRMSPGDALYEGTVLYIVSNNYFIVSDKDISRINAYAAEPNCIKDTHTDLLKYCYCYNTIIHHNNEHASTVG